MGDFELLDAQDVLVDIGGTPKRLQEAIDNGELGGGGTSVTVDTEMSDTSTNPVQNKVIKKYVDDNLTDVQTELTDIKKELSDGMTLVADAITAKGVETATNATLEVMAENIGAIKIGDDTSDATATAIDIMAGKTAYVNGVKITGTASSSELHGATISVSSSNNELVGTTVTLLKGETIVGTRILDESLACSFVGIQEIGEYVVRISDGTLTTEENVSITGDNIVNKNVITVVFNALSRLKLWLDAGRVTQSFSTLDEVFASEITVRQLMTIHASVDALKEWMIADPSIVDTFVANATAMKWMGLRDYAYDILTAGVVGLEEKILASENWEYALKDHVPVMTSNTSPYGEASANVEPTYGGNKFYAYNAFDGYIDDPITVYHRWAIEEAKTLTSGNYVQYKFENQICVKKLAIHPTYNTYTLDNHSFEIQASNDGINFDTLGEYIWNKSDGKNTRYISIDNKKYYFIYRYVPKSFTYMTSWDNRYFGVSIDELQFYGRSLNVSVPTMTSNTAPYGEAFSSSCLTNTAAWKVFNGDSSSTKTANIWASAGTVDGTNVDYIGYDFKKNVSIKTVVIDNHAAYTDGNYSDYEGKLQGSNDKNIWNDIKTIVAPKIASPTVIEIGVENNYRYYRLLTTKCNIPVLKPVPYTAFVAIQFYGIDYSEREFAKGSTMKYIYDHGVEFEKVNSVNNSASGTSTKEANNLKIVCTNAVGSYGFYTIIKLSNYNLMRFIPGYILSRNTSSPVLSMAIWKTIPSNTYSNRDAYRHLVNNLPTEGYLDVSSFNEEKYLFLGQSSGEAMSIVGTATEWWLE